MIVIIITRQWQKQYLLMINKVLLLFLFLLFNDECSDNSDL